MTIRFTFEPSDGWTDLRLVGPDGPIPVNSWSIEAPRELRSGVDLVHHLLACESALEERLSC